MVVRRVLRRVGQEIDVVKRLRRVVRVTVRGLMIEDESEDKREDKVEAEREAKVEE